jgi:hypothetical protein
MKFPSSFVSSDVVSKETLMQRREPMKSKQGKGIVFLGIITKIGVCK